MCNSNDMRKYFKMYSGKVDPDKVGYLSPIEADSLHDLPPAYVEVAEYDCLRDEGKNYADKLKEANVTVEFNEIKGAMHGYDIAVDSQLIKECMEKRVDFIKKIVLY